MAVPEEMQDRIKPTVPEELADRVIYVKNDCKDIWDWSEKVYGVIEVQA